MTIPKVGDKVPFDWFLFFVVVKAWEKNKLVPYDEDEDYSDFLVGNTYLVDRRTLDMCADSFKAFINNNCREATKEEALIKYNESYSNAIVGDVYDDGSYNIYHFYIPNEETLEIVREYEDFEDCWSNTRLNMMLEEHFMIWEKYRESFCLDFGNLDGEFFFYTEFNGSGKHLHALGSPMDSKDVPRFFNYTRQVTEKRRQEYEKEEQLINKEKEERYEKNKNNPMYYPGTIGNFNQVVVDKDRNVKYQKDFELEDVKNFFNLFFNYSGFISEDLKNKMIFYGGTIPYILLNEEGVTRKFGDIDIFVPIENMEEFRSYLESVQYKYFKYDYDSMQLTRKARLTAKGLKVNPKVFYCYNDEDYDAYKEYREQQRAEEEKALSQSKYQDYGFKGKLYDMNISVFPIYEWEIDGKTVICAKSFRIGENEGDWKFLLNTIVSKDTTIDEFCSTIVGDDSSCVKEHTLRFARIEYTIASKLSAINHGYKLRKETDEFDLDYIMKHKKDLMIDDELIESFKERIPDYGVSWVYRISRSNDVSVWSPEEYKHAVTRDDKPS